MDGQRSAIMLEDLRVHTKQKLSALWAALMFFYIYRDVLGFMEPGHIEAFAAGEIEGVQITQALLFGSAILMAVPSVMVFLALALNARVGRWVNLVLGLVYIVILAVTSFVGKVSGLYAFYMAVEFVLIALIVWHAWKWPTHEP